MISMVYLGPAGITLEGMQEVGIRTEDNVGEGDM